MGKNVRKRGASYTGIQCNRCKNRLRYISNGRCITCAKYWVSQSIRHKKARRKMVGKPCGICRKPMQNPCYDHEYISERFRGWLCHPCNRGIGAFAESLTYMRRAVLYLEQA